MGDEDSRYLVKIEMEEPNHFKQLFNMLKENNIVEVNLNITPDNLEILEMDPTHVVVAHVLLNASNFDTYYCREPIRVGVDAVNFAKILKSVGTKDTLTVFIEDTKELTMCGGGTGGADEARFGILIENFAKGEGDRIYIDTIDINTERMETPNLDYPYHVQLPAQDIQSIVTKLKNMVMGLDEKVAKILFHKDALQFFTKGDLGIIDVTRSRSSKEDSSIKVSRNENSEDDSPFIEIYVALEKLIEVTKCSCLSHFVTIYLKNDYPLFFEYDVGNLGFIRLGVSARAKPDNY